MNKKFFSGDSVRQALLQAARHFQVEPEQIAYSEVDRRHGFLRGRRRAVIEVDIDNPVQAKGADEETGSEERAESAPAESVPAEAVPVASPPLEVAPVETHRHESESPSAPEEPPTEALPTEDIPTGPPTEEAAAPIAGHDSSSPAPAEGAAPAGLVAESSAPVTAAVDADPQTVAAARQALDRIFELGRIDVEVQSVQMGAEKLEVELRGEDEELLLEDRGRLLLAIQHLLPRMLRGLTGTSTPCQVDCDDFHEIRTEQLRDLAQRVASEVRKQRRSRTLEPMSPDERRIVHLTLADDPAVETVSQGNGLFKRVQIRLQKMQPRGFDPFARE